MAAKKSIFHEVFKRPYRNTFTDLNLIAKDDPSFIQRLGLLHRLQVHGGCVNSLCWNNTGDLILSGSDDQHLVITNIYDYKVKEDYSTGHHANIFSAKFLPCTGDKQIVSCSGDGTVLHTDLERPSETYYNQFTCHGGTTTYEIMTIPQDPNTFMSCGEDGTVRLFDLRTKTSCFKNKCKENILVSCSRAITSLAVNPTATYQMSVGCADSMVRIFDRRYLSTQPGEHLKAQPLCTFVAPNFDEDRHYRITSLNYDADGKEMLVSYSSDYLYLFNVQENKAVELKKPSKNSTTGKRERLSPPPVRRLRLRGDWSDTGPDARPERDASSTIGIGQARPQLQTTLMQRMTHVLSRMLNDPMTRAALSAGGEDSVDPEEDARRVLEAREGSGAILEAREGGSAYLQESAMEGNRGSMETDDGQVETASFNEEATTEQTYPPVQTSSSEPATPQQEPSTANSTVTGHLHGHLAALRNLREGFINQHGSEPSVSFRYSQQSTSNSTISLRVRPEVGNSANNEDSANSGLLQNDTNSRDPLDASNEMDSDVELDFAEEDDDCISEGAFEKTEPTYTYDTELKRKYTGHRNARTMIKEATFWGRDHVMSGSDCGHVFVWDRHTAKLRMLLEADQHVVNCLRPHPFLPILATSGIDHDFKLWAPVLQEPTFDEVQAESLISRNAIMLEETRDTITVPAAFMIRMLACLNQIRRGGRGRARRPTTDDEPSNS